MNYQSTLEYLYKQLPMYQRSGSVAFKKDLTNTVALCAALGNPESKTPSIHIAGTNGKGSTAHMTAAILMESGYKVGLYTSPHLADFRERIKIDGKMVPESFVINFVQQHKKLIEELKPSFFEITVVMAFVAFQQAKVDVMVIETGLGGRLDSTNVITPLLSIITNISYDHVTMLGNTLPLIASEKAGIIKPNVPCVVGEKDDAYKQVLITKAKQTGSPIYFAEDIIQLQIKNVELCSIHVEDQHKNLFAISTGSAYQVANAQTVLAACTVLKPLLPRMSDDSIKKALSNFKELSAFRGRWDVLAQQPTIITDCAHNEAGIEAVVKQIEQLSFKQLILVLGFVNDKDVINILQKWPPNAIYMFTTPNVPRGLPVDQLHNSAASIGIQGTSYPSVQEAIQAAIQKAHSTDLIYIGGSTFVVAEAISHFNL